MTDALPATGFTLPPGEQLRRAMRRWVTGVAIVTSLDAGAAHGMTVNSFGSISLEPPRVTVTMNRDTRTCLLVQQSGIFAVTVLSAAQQPLAELFAGRSGPSGQVGPAGQVSPGGQGSAGFDRMAGLDTFSLVSGAPLIRGGISFVDCRVVHQYAMPLSILFIGEVVAATVAGPDEDTLPLVYTNRTFSRFG